MVLEKTQLAMMRVDAMLDEELAAVGLSNAELICGGFSQGAAISTYTGWAPPCYSDRSHALVDDARHCSGSHIDAVRI